MKNKFTLRDILQIVAGLCLGFSFILAPMTVAVNMPLAGKIVAGILVVGGTILHILVALLFDKKSFKCVATDWSTYFFLLLIPVYIAALLSNILLVLIFYAVWICSAFVSTIVDIVKYFKKKPTE